MGYVNAGGSTIGADGKWEHKFPQSFIGSLQLCPEQARAQYFDEIPREYTDSTALGESMHEGIEYGLYEKRDGPRLATVNEMVDVAVHHLEGLEWTYTKYSKAKMFAALHPMLHGWNVDILPHVTPLFIEWKFKYLLYAGKHRSVYVVGTADCVDADYLVWDWKSANREHEPWEHQRWAVQPTVYSFAIAQHLAELNGDNLDGSPAHLNDALFRYGVVFLDGETQVYDVARDESHVQWLRQQCSQIAWLIENDVKPWVLNDGGWWCSPKWCGKWDSCKGATMLDGWERAPK